MFKNELLFFIIPINMYWLIYHKTCLFFIFGISDVKNNVLMREELATMQRQIETLGQSLQLSYTHAPSSYEAHTPRTTSANKPAHSPSSSGPNYTGSEPTRDSTLRKNNGLNRNGVNNQDDSRNINDRPQNYNNDMFKYEDKHENMYNIGDLSTQETFLSGNDSNSTEITKNVPQYEHPSTELSNNADNSYTNNVKKGNGHDNVEYKLDSSEGNGLEQMSVYETQNHSETNPQVQHDENVIPDTGNYQDYQENPEYSEERYENYEPYPNYEKNENYEQNYDNSQDIQELNPQYSNENYQERYDNPQDNQEFDPMYIEPAPEQVYENESNNEKVANQS